MPGRFRQRQLSPVFLVIALAFGCVDAPDQILDPGWVEIEPGVAMTRSFRDQSKQLEGVFLEVPADAVSKPTAIRVSIPVTAEAFFLQTGGGAQQRTPAIRIEPFNRLFNTPVRLILPWYAYGETIPEVDIRAWSSDGIEGIPFGLWEATAVTTSDLPRTVSVPVLRGGYYWAGNWEDNPLRSIEQDTGQPCRDSLDGDPSELACDDDMHCQSTGCLADMCAATAVESYCRPTTATSERFGCRCRCAASLCQWVR